MIVNKIKALEGSGGDYLSNEIFYRVAFLRNKYNPNLKTGLIHLGFNSTDISFNERNQMVTLIADAIKQVILII
jgi:pyrrolidone-carboxylate peptidase